MEKLESKNRKLTFGEESIIKRHFQKNRRWQDIGDDKVTYEGEWIIDPKIIVEFLEEWDKYQNAPPISDG